MKILVVGGAGYIGSHFVLEAYRAGHDVVVFDDLSSGFKSNLDNGIDFFEGSTLSNQNLSEIMNSSSFDVAVYLAACKAAGESMTDPVKYASNNIIGGINFIKACVEYDVKKIVFSSSAAVYGLPLYNPIDEAHSLKPINFYGYTKKIIEENLKWFSDLKGIRYASLRYFNAAGYDSDNQNLNKENNPQNLIPLIMEVAEGSRRSIQVYGNDYSTKDGTGVRDYIHVTDLAKGHLASIDYLFQNDNDLTVNLGSGRGHSVLEIIKMTEDVSNRNINYKVFDRRDGDPDIVIASSKKATELIGWSPNKSDLHNIIRSTWNIYNR
jgi:UDP-glucose 4-epimerase